MAIVTLTDDNFVAKVEEAKGVVLVDFWAPWCMPCRLVGPIIEGLAKEYDGKATIGKLNVDDNGETAMKYYITGIPTVGIFSAGKMVNTIVGARPEKAYRQAIDAALEPPKEKVVAGSAEKNQHSITVFSTPTCSWCAKLKSYLHQNNVAFTDIDVSTDHAMAEKMVMRSGQMGVPQTWVDSQVIVGFDQRRIRDILHLPA